MKILIDATVGGDSTVVHRFGTTVFWKVVENRKTTGRFVLQGIQTTWRKAPQSTRTGLTGLWKTVKAVPKGVAKLAKKAVLPCG